MAAGILGGIGTALTVLKASGPAVEAIGGIVNRLIPDPEARANAALELQKLVTSERVQAAQAAEEMGKANAAATLSSVQRGDRYGQWRDAIGWIAAAGLAYAWFLQPLGEWAMTFVSAWNDINFPPPPKLDAVQVYAIIGTLLGGGVLGLAQRVVAGPK